MKAKVGYNLLYTVVFLLTHNLLYSQIKGVVKDSQKSKPIAGAIVFINGSDLSTQTNEAGEFSLTDLPEGFSELVLYKKGFSLFKSPMMIAKNKAYTLDLQLVREDKKNDKSKGNTASDPAEFQKKLCGNLGNNSCRILNPEKITIEKDNDRWTISATTPIEVENTFLGYQIFIYNKTFEFIDDPDITTLALRFEQSNQNNFESTQKNEKNRLNQYLGSLNHFLVSVSLGLHKSEGFTVVNNRLQELKDSLVSESKIAGYKQIKLTGNYQIQYKGEGERENSTIEIEGKLLVNALGVPINPKTVKITGAMKRSGLGSLLPINYIKELSTNTARMEQILTLEEKAYVHTDKAYYYPGDVIWFKAYLNFRSPLLRDSLSKTLYVDLINKQGKIIQSKVLRLDSGLAKGDFRLADSLKSQNYFLRAYTALSRNFGDENLYIKQIPVLSIVEKVSALKNTSVVEDRFVKISTSKKSYKPREKIEILLTSKDSINNPLSSNLSISVVDLNQVVDTNLPTIKNATPFLNRNTTNFIYDLTYPVEFGLNLGGRLLNDKQKPQKGRLNIFQLKPTGMRVAEANELGEFKVNNLLFYDTTTFTFQIEGKETRGKVELATLAKPLFFLNIKEVNLAIEKTDYRQRNFSEIELDKDAKILNEVTVESKKDEKVENARPYGAADYIIPASRIRSGYPNILYSLQGIAGLQVNPTTGDVLFSRALRLSTLGTLDPLVTINDVPADKSILMQLDPNTVQSIEITKRMNVLYGSQGANGIIAIYLKKGATENVPSSSNIPSVKAMGYSKAIQFKAPEYADLNSTKSRDERATIYWNPEVKISSKIGGVKALSFYAADLPTNYKIVVEGINELNKSIHAEAVVMIEK